MADKLVRSELTYRNIIGAIPSVDMIRAYGLIESCYNSVHKYVQVWLQYQALWDMQTGFVVSRLGDNLNKVRVVFFFPLSLLDSNKQLFVPAHVVE